MQDDYGYSFDPFLTGKGLWVLQYFLIDSCAHRITADKALRFWG